MDNPLSPSNVYSFTKINFIFQVSILTILLCMAFIGNILALFVIIKSHRVQWHTNIIVGHLAFVHCCFTSITCCLYIYCIFKGQQMSSNLVFQLLHYCNFVNSSITIFLLSFTTFDRYNVIVDPLTTQLTRENTLKVLATLWTVSLVISTPSFYFMKTRKNYFGIFCPGNEMCVLWKLYLASYFILCLLVPTIFIVVLNIKIFRTIHRRHLKPRCGVIVSKNIRIVRNIQIADLGPVPRTKVKTVKMLIVLDAWYLLSWLPYIMYYLFQISDDFNYAICFFVFCMTSANSAINPLIYWFWNGNFRRKIQHIFQVNISSPYSLRTFSQKVHPKETSSDYLRMNTTSTASTQSSLIFLKRERRLSLKLFQCSDAVK